jgi:hypothetical protein
MISGLVDKIPGIGQFDVAGRPKFSLEGNNPLPDTVTTTFNLHNYNIDALIANLKFIHSITAGAFWIQSGFMQVSSNLYDVEIPGRFRYYLCKANVKVDWSGKVRSMREAQLKQIRSAFPKISNREAISKFPDMYTVTLEFYSLMPNNFNTHLNYLIGANEVSVGQYKDNKTDKVGTAILLEIENANVKAKKAADEADRLANEKG